MEGEGILTSCTCPPGYSGSNCSVDLMFCMADTCLNGGTCIDGQGDIISCECADGYTGMLCGDDDPNFIACLPNPCQNGGNCSEAFGPNFDCTCPIGFSGDECRTDLDFCDSTSCDNGGTCVEDIGPITTCVCPSGYIGGRCETDDDTFCTREGRMCLNGGTCMEGDGPDTSCDCLFGFDGDNCENDLPFCDETRCRNGATCVEGHGPLTTCICAAGFTGPICATPIPSGACQSNSDCPGTEFCQIRCLADTYPSHTSLLSETVHLTGVSFLSVPRGQIPAIPQDLTIFLVFRQQPGNRGYAFFYGTSPDSRNIGVFLDSTTTTPGIYLYYTSAQGLTTRAIRVQNNVIADNRTHSLAITIATSISPGSARFFLDGALLGMPRALAAPDLALNVSRATLDLLYKCLMPAS